MRHLRIKIFRSIKLQFKISNEQSYKNNLLNQPNVSKAAGSKTMV